MTGSLPPIKGTIARSREPDFYDGILAALAVVDAHGQQTIGQSIVNTVDKDKLFARADAHDRKVLVSLGIKP